MSRRDRLGGDKTGNWGKMTRLDDPFIEDFVSLEGTRQEKLCKAREIRDEIAQEVKALVSLLREKIEL